MLNSCRMLTGNYTQDIVESIFLMNNHLMKDETQGTLIQPVNTSITVDTETKPYIVEQLNSIKLSRSQYQCNIHHQIWPYVETMFTLQNFAHKFHQKLVHVINAKTPAELLK